MDDSDDQPVGERKSGRLPRIRETLARVQPSDWIASIAAFTAIVSLVISVLGYRLAQEQTALSRDQFEQGRSFWWLCSIDENLNLSLVPSRNDAAVESAVIVFPKSLFGGTDGWVLRPKNLQLSLQEIHKRLMSTRASEVTFDRPTGRFNIHAAPYLLPMIVESRYIVGGSMHSDRTMFFIRIRTKFSLGPAGVNNIKLESVLLSDASLHGKLANESDDTDEILSRYWDEPGDDVVAQVAPIGGAVTMEGPFPRRGQR